MTMKNFQKYFYETSKVYEFKIKIANCDVSASIDAIKNAVDAYCVETISKPKRLPIQEHREFGNLGPCECEVIDITVRYPVIAEQIRQLVINRAGIAAACVYVYTKDQYLQEEEVDARILAQGEDGPIIENPELKADEGGQEIAGQIRIGSLLKELEAHDNLNKAYVVDGNDTNQDSVREKGSKKGQTTNDVPAGDASPVGTNKQKISDPTKGQK